MKPNSVSQFDDAQIEKLLAETQAEAPGGLKHMTMNRIHCQTRREGKQFLLTSWMAFVCLGFWLNVVLMLGVSSAGGIASTTTRSQQNFSNILEARQNLFYQLENP